MAGSKQNKMVTVGFVPLGCPKNTVDSEKMLGQIGQAGFVITADADSADVVVINTCGFIGPAKVEALAAIRRAVAGKKKAPARKVIVTGCLPQRFGRRLLTQMNGVDAIVGLGQRDRIVQIIERTLLGREPAAYLRPVRPGVQDDRARLLLTPRHWAYLRISEGCNRKCSFCTIPAIRGRFRSKPPELVLEEARELVANGVVELNIVAQDTTVYGRELGLKHGLSRLVKELAKIERLRWIRLMYLYPAAIDEILIETIGSTEKVVKYVDMPVQHINDDILRAMRRPDRKECIIRLIGKLRATMPDVALRTTVMVGFPGESRRQFKELVDFVRWARFDALGCFRFYAEPPTAAASMAGQIPREVKKQRYERIMAEQQKIAFAKNRLHIGRELLCLVESVNRRHRTTGRYYGQAPCIDGVCIVRSCRCKAGEFARVRITGSRGYDLVAQEIC